jgi:hypothetical protein
MYPVTIAISASAFWLGIGLAGDEPLKSGPQVGDAVATFLVEPVTGRFAEIPGLRVCFV